MSFPVDKIYFKCLSIIVYFNNRAHLAAPKIFLRKIDRQRYNVILIQFLHNTKQVVKRGKSVPVSIIQALLMVAFFSARLISKSII